MEILWAPWRMDYIRSPKKESSACVFCDKLENVNDRENLVLYRSAHSFVAMNPYPYNNGHLMVLPYKHASDFDGMDDETMLDLIKMTRFSTDMLRKAFAPEGFNVGFNIGKVAGAGLGEHLHIHIVPRWTGDVGFMTVIGELRVIPQHLFNTYDTLYPIFNP